MLLSQVFADQTFGAPGITGREQFFVLQIPPELNQQELPLKVSMTGVPLF